jgi:uncharacterized protein DUF5667
MNSEYERLNEQLERGEMHLWSANRRPDQPGLPTSTPSGDAEIDRLVMVARRLQASPQVQADPAFAGLLERRLLQRQASLRRERSAPRGGIPRLWRMHPVFSVALSLCVLFLVLGTGVLAATGHVSNPENPLYFVKHWEQHVQVSLASSSRSRAELEMQFARERLNTLADLANPTQADAYRQALADFDQQLSTARSAIAGLSAGSDRERLSGELAALEVEARQKLRGFLPQVDLAERLVTTDELGRLGETVPHLLSVEITLQGQVNEPTATISISGDDLQPGAQLLVNGQIIDAPGFFQNGQLVFTISWNGDQHTQSIGILNADGTVAQTTVMTMKSSNGNGNGNSGNSNNAGHGNGNNNGKPGRIPTPHH